VLRPRRPPEAQAARPSREEEAPGARPSRPSLPQESAPESTAAPLRRRRCPLRHCTQLLNSPPLLHANPSSPPPLPLSKPFLTRLPRARAGAPLLRRPREKPPQALRGGRGPPSPDPRRPAPAYPDVPSPALPPLCLPPAARCACRPPAAPRRAAPPRAAPPPPGQAPPPRESMHPMRAGAWQGSAYQPSAGPPTTKPVYCCASFPAHATPRAPLPGPRERERTRHTLRELRPPSQGRFGPSL
jgi:hypothetical protein